MLAFLTWICFPIYIVQGIYVRIRSIRMSPARGAKSGVAGVENNSAKPISLLCIGDSGIAGVGCAQTSDSLTPNIAQELSTHLKRPVLWRIAGFNSATTGEILRSVVPNLERGHIDHIYMSVSANDIKNWHTQPRYKREFGNLIYALHARFPDAQIWWSPVAPYSKFPLLPWPLNSILEWRAQILGKTAQKLCIERDVNFIPRMEDISVNGFAEDGFHPNALANQAWAKHLVAHMKDRL